MFHTWSISSIEHNFKKVYQVRRHVNSTIQYSVNKLNYWERNCSLQIPISSERETFWEIVLNATHFIFLSFSAQNLNLGKLADFVFKS